MRENGLQLPAALTRRLDRRRFLKKSALVSSGLLVWLACGDGDGGGDKALTTLDATIILTPDGGLLEGPGEPHVVRTELAAAGAARATSRRSLLAFHHLSDFRIIDEESPLRSEWLESCPSPLSTSAFRPQESLSLHAAAALISRANQVTQSPVTGRAVDLAVHTGNAADNAHRNELRWFIALMDGQAVTPGSGTGGYQGVQQESPASAYPSLLQEAQLTFRPEALRYPWYAVLGNRDVLVRGSFPASSAATAIAGGTQKILSLGPESLAQVCADPLGTLDPATSSAVVAPVAPDRDRALLGKDDFIQEHFRTQSPSGPPGHGFRRPAEGEAPAYYTVDRNPVLLVVLDTVNPAGFSGGSIEPSQLGWLEEQLIAHHRLYYDASGRLTVTQNPDRLIVVASHHPASDMNNTAKDPASEQERIGGDRFRSLLQRFPNVVLHIAGHRAQNRISAQPDPLRRAGGYWEVTTGSPLDYPMQGRLLELVDNADGTLSIFSTVYDSAAPLVPDDAEDPTPDDGLNQALLASVARQLAASDPQIDRDAAGIDRSDRNAELLISAPFAVPAPAPADGT